MPGYRASLVEQGKAGFFCPHCKLILCQAVQTDDGERLCNSCFKEIAQMPDATCQDCHITVDPGKGTFPDRAVRRDILELLVKCAHADLGCPWTGMLNNWEEHCEKCVYKGVQCPNEGCTVTVSPGLLNAHLSECPHRIVSCEYCLTKLQNIFIESHLEECPCVPVLCKQCHAEVRKDELEVHLWNKCPIMECRVCGQKVSRESHEEIVVCDGDDDEQVSSTVHLSEPASVFRHIQLLSDQISLLRKDIDVQRAGFEEAIAKSSRDLSELHSMVKQLSEHVSQLQPDQGIDTGLENRVAALEEKEASSKELSSHQRSQLADMKQKVLSLNDACENNVQQLAQLQRSSQNRESRTTGSAEGTGSGQLLLESKAEELERGMSTLKYQVSELELQLQASLASTHNGAFLWRIPDVARRRREAVEDKVTSIYSPPFYTGRNGYKMCVRAYLNGDGIGLGTHLSVFFVLMKGEYDPLLKWPFECKVSLILVDQNHRRHIVQTFKPTAESSSFQRPQNDMNVASGCPQFAKLVVLTDNSYVKDDVMFIKCIVDTSRIFHP